jgi:biotin-dependent carboxylase-like uncharacterized protein
MDSNILVLSSGLQSSIQDLGRKGFRCFGVPISGAMDKYSAILANKLLNNEEGLPLLEMTCTGSKLFFEDETFIVLTGANLSPELNGKAIDLNLVHKVKSGDVLSFGKQIFGSRTYLGVKGGFLTETKLNSRSYFSGITEKGKIEKGDRLQIAPFDHEFHASASKLKIKKIHFKTKKLEVTKGPEFNRLTKRHRLILFKREFTIDALNNRMGYQIKNKYPTIEKSEIITSIVIPGTVQLTPSGKLIIMMRDCPTTGGYPRVLQLTDIAINQLAQKRTGDTFKFELESSYGFLSRLVHKFRDKK